MLCYLAHTQFVSKGPVRYKITLKSGPCIDIFQYIREVSVKLAVGYIRVSTEEQVKEGVSLEAQEDAIRRRCECEGYHLLEIFKDAGISGYKSHNRPALQQAL